MLNVDKIRPLFVLNNDRISKNASRLTTKSSVVLLTSKIGTRRERGRTHLQRDRRRRPDIY